MSDQIFAYRDGGMVEVERVIEVYGVLDRSGRDDDESGTWRSRTVAEFAQAIAEAEEGLTDAYVEAREDHGSGVVIVRGMRPQTTDEAVERERREHMLWLSAKGTYERGLAKWGQP